MIRPGKPENETDRLRALRSYDILDTLPEKAYDDITAIAAEICRTPISMVSIIDKNRQWFKSHQGITATETPRDLAFCAHAILNPHEILIVSNSTMDERFKDNPLVTGDPHVIFYAGMPLVNPEGYALGTLCVVDKKPKILKTGQILALKKLANQVVMVLELRRKIIELNECKMDLERSNKDLESFARVVAHDLKTPLNSIISITDLLKLDYVEKFNDPTNPCLTMLGDSAQNLTQLINGILAYSRVDKLTDQPREKVNLSRLIQEVLNLVEIPPSFKVNYGENLPEIYIHKTGLQQILLNLIGNAVKYNLKDNGVVEIKFAEEDNFFRFSVMDNGLGIPEEQQQKIFDLFTTLDVTDRFNNKGTGIGLSTVKKLVERLGGEISVKSQLGVGSEFSFTCRKR